MCEWKKADIASEKGGVNNDRMDVGKWKEKKQACYYIVVKKIE